MSDYTGGPVRERAVAEGADLFIEKEEGMGLLLEFVLQLRSSIHGARGA